MRIKLSLPEKRVYTQNIRIRTNDINLGGHLGNEQILIYAQECRTEWIFGLGYQNEGEICGTQTIVADAAIQYLQEAYALEELVINLYLGDLHRFGVDLYYEALRKSKDINADLEPIAIAKTAILFIDTQTKKLVSPPAEFIKKITGS